MYGDHYRSQQAATASPAQLVTMLYDGVLTALARLQVADQSTEVVNRELQRAQAIVRELQMTLDFDRGGDVAANLSSLYTWMLEQLVDANVRKDVSGLGAVAESLTALRDAWVEAAATQDALAVAGSSQ